MRKSQSGQVLVIVAVWMVALIGSAALVLLAGSVEWQQNQLQQLADQAALDSALKIGVGCSAGSAGTVITEADNFVATQRTRTGSLSISGASCTNPYTGTDTFGGGLSETIHYPYRAHQQQVEVILTLSLPISFGSYMGVTNTTVTRRGVAQQLNGSTAAVSATTLACTGGQVNVTGSVVAQNAITLSGGCALYAHSRFDATSGTYSDLADVDVYTDAQTWSAAGSCTAGSNSGSSNAICADGHELTGHVTPTCATATTSFLSAGDATVNANPCAGGVARPPVAPRSTSLPPEPNADPSAVATLPGATACSSGASYPNLVVGGSTVGTAEVGTAAPVKDSANYYHFKPSCYGYLNPGALAGGSGTIALVRTGALAGPSSTTVTATLAPASTAGDLLVVNIRSSGSTQSTAPAGWLLAAGVYQANAFRSEIWYYPGAPSTASATFNVGSGNLAVAQMSEWSGADTSSPLDQVGTKVINSPARTATISTSGATAVANELVITNNGFEPNGGETYSSGAGWTNLSKNSSDGYASDYRLNLPAGVASETATFTTFVDWSMVIATFKPATAAAGAVLDPGFYYFNGSGFAGGGGICLNGGVLLGRDVTLEFVNQAGFSSGTCAAGGGGGCSSGSCQFGSTPCSISACPPNTVADSVTASGNTWFAAPCSQAPAGDASCPGSAWCPTGDRACTNLLIWAPASNTGQVALTGSSAKAWLLGSVYWPGTCTYRDNGTSMLDGTVSCGTLSISAAAGSGTAIGSDYGINTAVVEAVLVE